jgi:formimidoylglutamate deiminase
MTATLHPQRALFAANALLPEGWASNVLLTWDETGRLTGVRSVDATMLTNVQHAAGPLIAGMPNLHSHAFQRAFAGLSEYRSAGKDKDKDSDTFWTWRDLMYRFALAISPEQLEDIATHLYVEMLQAGYTSVCEFHYLHHDASGKPYSDPAEMSQHLLAAAQRAGIGITLLPVLYQNAGFGALPPHADQRRFINSVDGLLRIVERIRSQDARVGVAPHSLRAVAPNALAELIAGMNSIDPSAPIHIHIAEQAQELQDCLGWCGQRPVQWLLDHTAVDARWCLVHATHMSAPETRAAAATGATIGVCPSTEANLGDGVFDAVGWAAANGHWGVGSDSHASVNAAEELRSLEYSQRLTRQQRNVLASSRHAQVADQLWLASTSGGARASGRPVGALAVGAQADFVVLDVTRALADLSPSQALAHHVFASHVRNTVRDVWVGGLRRITCGRHALEGPACERFVAARSQLLREV